MFRHTALRVSRSTRAYHISRVNSYSVVDNVKQTLDAANKKTGEFLALTMEAAEHAPEKLSGAAEKVNKTTGKVLADGMQKVEDVTPNAENLKENAEDQVVEGQQKANQAYADGKDKVDDVMAEGKEKAQNIYAEGKGKVDEVMSEGKEKAQDVYTEGKAKIESTSHTHHKARVDNNAQGYESLQDKGAKAEVEQNRPEDGV